jgi:L-ascorbate metabolism protein UlaG (beta-lactamase superfamily)
MALIGQGGLDLAVLPIGDNYTMGPEDGLTAVTLLKPKAVIPCHYNTWPLLAVDAPAWKAQVEAETDSKVVIPAVDEAYMI